MSVTTKIDIDGTRIKEEISNLSRLLGMIPNDYTITVSDPMTNESMELSKWLDQTRDSFLQLSVLIGQELNIDMQ